MIVNFHEIDFSTDLKYSVIVSKDKNGYVFVKHKDRETWEIPGGHIDEGETSYDAAKRELIEETGAKEFEMKEICKYSVSSDNKTSYGSLFYAEIDSYLNKLDFEIVEVRSFKQLPNNLTYSEIQPYLFVEVLRRIG